MREFDRAAIAARLRGLIAGQDDGDLGKTAARLAVEEVSLRISVDELSPHPTVEVLAAVIREYGVDPGWLLTGDYATSTHRAAIENGGVESSLQHYMSTRPGSISEPPPEQFHITDPNR